MKIFREVPVEGEGYLYDLHSCMYEYKPDKEKVSIETHDKTEKYIRGFVKDKHLPVENGVMKMFYHKTTDKIKFGAIKLSHCKNVIKENGNYYFESKGLKYILIRAKTD